MKYVICIGAGFHIATKPLPKSPRKPPSCPELLEIRHFVQYEKLSKDVREQIVNGINAYGDFVLQEQELEQGLQPKDPRTEEEKAAADELVKKVIRCSFWYVVSWFLYYFLWTFTFMCFLLGCSFNATIIYLFYLINIILVILLLMK